MSEGLQSQTFERSRDERLAETPEEVRAALGKRAEVAIENLRAAIERNPEANSNPEELQGVIYDAIVTLTDPSEWIRHNVAYIGGGAANVNHMIFTTDVGGQLLCAEWSRPPRIGGEPQQFRAWFHELDGGRLVHDAALKARRPPGKGDESLQSFALQARSTEAGITAASFFEARPSGAKEFVGAIDNLHTHARPLDREQKVALFAGLLREHGFELVMPEEETFPPGIRYDSFEGIPPREVDSTMIACRLFMEEGLYLFDHYENRQDERHQAQVAFRDTVIAPRLGTSMAYAFWKEVREKNRLRVGGLQMTVTQRLIRLTAKIREQPERGEKDKALRELLATLPVISVDTMFTAYTFSPEDFKWLEDKKPEVMARLARLREKKLDEKLGFGSVYLILNDEEKMRIIHRVEEVCRGFLTLATAPA